MFSCRQKGQKPFARPSFPVVPLFRIREYVILVNGAGVRIVGGMTNLAFRFQKANGVPNFRLENHIMQVILQTAIPYASTIGASVVANGKISNVRKPVPPRNNNKTSPSSPARMRLLFSQFPIHWGRGVPRRRWRIWSTKLPAGYLISPFPSRWR